MRYLRLNYFWEYNDDYRSSILKNNHIFPSKLCKNMKKIDNIFQNDKWIKGLINLKA